MSATPTRILLIEDDPLVAMMLEGCLDALGIELAGSATGVNEALAAIERGQFDAALVDVHLANGETSDPIAIELRARGIPFLVMTGTLTVGGPAFAGAPLLTKPFTLASFRAALVRANIC